MTPEELKELRKRYTPPKKPKCHICGSDMNISYMGPDCVKYRCSSVKYIGGTEQEAKHWSDSVRKIYQLGDSLVIKLLNEYKKENK